MIIDIKQIGNGGALNTEDTNSSFLISLNEELLLFDCGYSVYTKLRKLDRKGKIDLKHLKYVYISHLDDDHVGSLKSLMYYQFFVNKIRLNILFDKKIHKELNSYINFKKINKHTVKDNYKFIKQKIVKPIKIKNNKIKLNVNDNKKIKLKTINTEHHKECFGLKIKYKKYSFAITGDTVAIKKIEKACKKCDFVFHDFSKWNEPSRQVHACEDNIKQVYSKKFINKLKFYHNDEKYNKKWINLYSEH